MTEQFFKTSKHLHPQKTLYKAMLDYHGYYTDANKQSITIFVSDVFEITYKSIFVKPNLNRKKYKNSSFMSVIKNIAIGSGGHGFVFQAGQIGCSFPNGSPPLRCFFGAMCIVRLVCPLTAVQSFMIDICNGSPIENDLHYVCLAPAVP